MSQQSWAVACMLCIGFWRADAGAQDASRYPLMTIEQHRASVVTAIVDKWSSAFAVLPQPEQRSADRLRAELWQLRSDRLLAASLAGSFVTVAQVLNDSKAEADGGTTKPSLKRLGDTFQDLAFTPLTPCRMVDTRVSGGPLSPSVTRTFIGYAASFAAQGGVSNGCFVPDGVAALALNVAAVQPSAAGFISFWPANLPRPLTGSAINYGAADFATATGTIVPVDTANANQFNAWSPAGVDVVVDVVGYFRSPQPTPLDCTTTLYNDKFLNAGVTDFVDSPQCDAGYQTVSGSCGFAVSGGGAHGTVVLSEYTQNLFRCWGTAPAGGNYLFSAARCCRVPGH